MTEHNHLAPPSRGQYVHGCRHPDCRALDTAYKRAWSERKRAEGHRSPSQEKAYHAAYMRQHRAEMRNETPKERTA